MTAEGGGFLAELAVLWVSELVPTHACVLVLIASNGKKQLASRVPQHLAGAWLFKHACIAASLLAHTTFMEELES